MRYALPLLAALLPGPAIMAASGNLVQSPMSKPPSRRMRSLTSMGEPTLSGPGRRGTAAREGGDLMGLRMLREQASGLTRGILTQAG